VPFGLKTEYDADWMGRFQAINRISRPSMSIHQSAYKVSEECLSRVWPELPDRINAELSNARKFWPRQLRCDGGNVAATNAVAAAGREGTASVKGSDKRVGDITWVRCLRLHRTPNGLSYRSSIKYHVTGTVVFLRPFGCDPYSY